jgi:hypothetical protein
MFITKYRDLLQRHKLKRHMDRINCFINNCSEDNSCHGLLGGDNLSDYTSYYCLNCEYFTPIIHTK